MYAQIPSFVTPLLTLLMTTFWQTSYDDWWKVFSSDPENCRHLESLRQQVALVRKYVFFCLDLPFPLSRKSFASLPTVRLSRSFSNRPSLEVLRRQVAIINGLTIFFPRFEALRHQADLIHDCICLSVCLDLSTARPQILFLLDFSPAYFFLLRQPLASLQEMAQRPVKKKNVHHASIFASRARARVRERDREKETEPPSCRRIDFARARTHTHTHTHTHRRISARSVEEGGGAGLSPQASLNPKP